MHATHTYGHTSCDIKQEPDLCIGWTGATGEKWEGLWDGGVGSGRDRPNLEVLRSEVIEKPSPSPHS